MNTIIKAHQSGSFKVGQTHKKKPENDALWPLDPILTTIMLKIITILADILLDYPDFKVYFLVRGRLKTKAHELS